ncbi:hormogonium polysaccharide secretion pseudopilin HpsC [Microcoleus sp. herbarium12]|uniref:hormogonium polysaccharide secretion pseudopilin HpsC n=1 Tax=Microcoleus sp. herbarium12 TaxID=3055437 RepID=UPI002FCE6AA2
MKTLLRLLLKTQHQKNRSGPTQTEKGMTLVELLIGAVMAFLIITPMLAFVVDMLNSDRREQVKSNTEQDIQAAVDFIAEDLSQAIYIYDNNTTTGIPELTKQKFIPTGADKTPILVFWKRQQIKQSVPINSTIATPKTCDATKCNDTYVLSLVAYYQFKDKDNTWCQPDGTAATCPTRIARYEIRDGVRKPDPIVGDANLPYYNPSDTDEDTQQPDIAFNKDFDFTKPTQNVTKPAELTKPKSGGSKPQVLVNYIDHNTPVQPLSATECQTALGSPADPKTSQKLAETTLKVTDANTDSFYACVDTAKNIARVTIRGNSLRRLQDSTVKSSAQNSAFFPTATVQVQGRGALGK